MSDGKVDPSTLTLRAPPRPVTRINRRTLAAILGILGAIVLGATVWSLQSSRRTTRDAPVELHNVERVNRAEGLDQLPQDYSKLPLPRPFKPSPTVPALGPPLPGDLGGPLLRAEREIANAEDYSELSGRATALRPDPNADAARVERLNRQREAEEAAKGGLFFKASGRKEIATASSPPEISTHSTLSPSASTPGISASKPDANTGGASQDEKQRFVQQASSVPTQSKRALIPAGSPYQVMAGTIIPAALVTGINSDLPGQVIASVTEAVYDSVTGRHLLIPQGSRLLGQYDSQVAFGQRRVLLVWTRLILPDASSITFERVPGVDSQGRAGLEDNVDWHWQHLLAGAALSTLIGVGAELAAPDRGNGQGQVVIAARGSLQESINQAGQELTRRNLNVQPTLTVRAGFPVRVIVNQDLTLRPYQPLFFERSARHEDN